MPLSPERSLSLRIAGISLLALASWWLPKLALPTCLLVLLVALSFPRLKASRLRLWGRTIVVLAGLLAGGAFVGFILHEAIPGVIAGGNQDTEKRAVALLRTFVVAEDKMRVSGWLDPDGDHIGSAATLSELSGHRALRTGVQLAIPPLYMKPEQFIETDDAVLISQGAYVFKLCLPQTGGGWSAGDDASGADPEAAERSFYAYAWPRNYGAGSPQTTYFIDAQERILVHTPHGPAPLRYQGAHAGPACNAVDESAGDWSQWKDKEPRAELPGDTPTQNSQAN